MMNFGNSPLLDMGTGQQQPQMMDAELQKMYEAIQQKRASHNIIAKHKDSWGKSIDNATLFIADEDGNIDADTIFSDLMQMLENINNYEFDFGFIKGRIDGGALVIDLPDNIITTILFGSKKSISFTKNDFEELRSLITAE